MTERSVRGRQSTDSSLSRAAIKSITSASGVGQSNGVDPATVSLTAGSVGTMSDNDVEAADCRAALLPIGTSGGTSAMPMHVAGTGCSPYGGGVVGGIGKLDASATIVLGGTSSPPAARRAPPQLNRRATIQQSTGGVPAGNTAVTGTGIGGRGRGTSTSSSNAAGSLSGSTWRLKYQDFLPTMSSGGNKMNVGEDSTESFQKLVDRANEWLRRNSEMQVRTCETITWMSHDLKTLCTGGNYCQGGDQMVLSKRVAEDAQTYCIRGLRLWIVPQTVNKPQYLCFTDFAPSPERDHIQSLVSSVNTAIDQSQLTGQVLTVETISLPINPDGSIDCGVTRWTECANSDSPYAFALRVFHNKEVNGRIYGTERAHIAIKDFVPQPTENTYEGFEDLIDRMNYWLKEQTEMHLTNLQSVMVQKQNGPHSETGSACFFSQPGINRPYPVDFFRILRIAYLKPVGDLLVELPVIHPISYETFTPELVKAKELGGTPKERVEKMKETFTKVTSFLQGLNGDIVCAEMVSNPMQLYPQDNVHILPPVDEIKFLLTIRLFYTGRAGSHIGREGSVRSAKRPSVGSYRGGAGCHTSGGQTSRSSPRNSDNSEHPGPIFLRHVVSRRFEYRWMILASTAITCMTIIVVVSVVYSNI